MSRVVDVDRLLGEAAAAAGSDDFGDPTFRDGLDVFAAAIDSEARLNDAGKAAVVGQLRGVLNARLGVERWWAEHPELAEERIDAPVFIVGLSRSGTTALSHLLARDPANRSLLGWEASTPVPPPQPATYASDPRFEAARAREFGLLHELNPAIAAAHHDPPDLPVECLVTMSQHFVSLSLPTQYPTPTYARWVLRADHAAAYRWHERVLRLLQSGGVRGRWLLKSPQHSIALDALVQRYPDATFIVTHRDPATCVASVSSLAHEFARAFAEPRAGTEFGTLWTELMGAMSNGLVEHRRAYGDERFIDVAYRDLTTDPITTVARIYEQLGRALSPQAESAMRTHVDVAVQHRYGRHRYEWNDFGLERGALDERFSEYRDRFAALL